MKTFFEKTILENINLDGYELPNPYKYTPINKLTDYDKIKIVYKIFENEYLHFNNEYLPKEVNFKNWLLGLPNILVVPFIDSEIIENAKKSNCYINCKDNYLIEIYWRSLSDAFFTLKNNI